MPKKISNKTSVQQELINSNLTLQSKLIELVQSNKELTESFKTSASQTKELLDFFKEAGKYMVAETEDEKLKPLLGKISSLVEQNQTIMRSLILIQKYIKSSPQPETKELFPE